MSVSLKQTTSGQLLHNLLLFGRVLRELELDINPGRMIDVVSALQHIEIGRKEDFYCAMRTLLVNRHEDLTLFDQAFDLFWRKPQLGELVTFPVLALRKRKQKPIVTPPPLKPEQDDRGDSDDTTQNNQPPLIEVTRTYSAREVLRQKDFAEMTAEELFDVKKLMQEIVWQMDQRRTRRSQAGHGQQMDMRRTLRRNMRYGGDILYWSQRQPKYKPRPIVIIADISGSMERYTRLLLHFIYSLSLGLSQSVESFVFSTRLTRITHQLDDRDVDRALRDVGTTVKDWAGGTRIGESLKTFNFVWGRRVLGHGAVILIISDGWDRGVVELLSEEMARLKRNCHRVIWLNPLLGSPDYEPLTRGIQAALPHIDNFLPVHNLASLEGLAEQLTKLKERR